MLKFYKESSDDKRKCIFIVPFFKLTALQLPTIIARRVDKESDDSEYINPTPPPVSTGGGGGGGV